MLQSFFGRIRPWHLITGLLVLLGVLYVPFMRSDFVTLDDGLLVTKNLAVQQITLRSLGFIFTHFDPELYIPLTFFSYQLNDALFGLNATMFHLTNLVIHAANVLLLFSFAFVFTKKKSVAFLCALLFAVHPLQTEAVMWVSSRKDLLSGFFFLLTLLLYVLYHRDLHKKFLYGAVLAFFLGLLSKVSILLLPLLLLLIDWLHGRPWQRVVFREKIPFFIQSAFFGVIAVIGKKGVVEASSPWQNALLGLKSIAFYLQKIFYPVSFSVIYPQETPVTLGSLEFLVPLFVFIALIVLMIVSFKRWRMLTFCLLFFLLMLLPSFTNFYKNGFLFFASDRYAYLAAIGIFLLLAQAGAFLWDRAAYRPLLGIAAVLLITPILLFQTRAQARTWKNSETLYRNVILLYPGAALAHNNLGDVLWKSDRKEEAKTEFQAALAIDPHLVSAHVNMGGVYMLEHDPDHAITEYHLAVENLKHKNKLNIDEVAVYYFLANALVTAGRPEESLAQYETVVSEAPELAEPHYNLGLQYQQLGRADDAVTQFQAATTIDSWYVDAHYHLAGLYAEKGLLQEALAELDDVLSINPTYEHAADHRAAIVQLLNR